MYDVYLDKILCPIAPEKLQLKVNNNNKTVTLINDGEVNILKKAGLTEISFDLLLPNSRYPFAVYKSGFKSARYFLREIEKLKTSRKPFKFKVVRKFPNGRMLFTTNMKVSLEEYSITDDAQEGVDVVVSIKLKQYKNYGTKTCRIKYKKPKKTKKSSKTKPKPKPKLVVKKKRSVNPKKIGIGSTVIVNGRLHRDSYGSAPGQTRKNYRGKINFINKKGSHPYHVTTPSGSWLGWVKASAVKAI